MDRSYFINEESLNIFCDASTRSRGSNIDVCYGALAVHMNDIVDQVARVNSNSTNNNAEIKAIRSAIMIALKHREEYKVINIFSDSQVSLFGIRDRIFSWKYNEKENVLYGYGSAIKSQDVFLDILNIIVSHNLAVNFYHQKAHVYTGRLLDLKSAAKVFMASNGIREKIDYNLIRYISDYNNKIDAMTRKLLLSTDTIDKQFIEPIKFGSIDFYSQVNQYNNIIMEGKKNGQIK